MKIFYTELASFWPLISPVEEYAGEAAEFARVLSRALPGARTLLELGSGGGHNGYYLKHRFELLLTDLSAEMVEASKRLNPGCDHLIGDMRTLRLGRTFDAVFVHDAIHYMTTEEDLAAAITTAAQHCRPGGVALFVPDVTTESFAPGSSCDGHDAPDGRGVRYLEWTYDADPTDSFASTHFAFIVREADGTMRTLSETHDFGLFPEATWVRLLGEAGFETEVVVEETDEERPPRRMFLGRRRQPQ